MTRHRGIVAGLLIGLTAGGLAAGDAMAQASANGRLYGALYVSEDTAAGKLYDSYLGLLLNAAPIASSRDFRVKADLRVARVGDPADWNEKVFSLYADWRSKNRTFDARFGRQFLWRGVMNGSVDGLWLRARPTKRFEIGAFGGLATRYGNSLDLHSWDEGGTIGGLVGFRFLPGSRAEVTYINRRSSGATAWHQIGGSVSGKVLRRLLYDAQLDYNIEKETIQAGRLRLTYFLSRWTIGAEYNNQKPRIFEDSYFNIFEIEAYQQIRGNLSYRLGRYSIGAAYLHTMYGEDEAGDHDDDEETASVNDLGNTGDQILLSLTGPWGTVGGLLQGGYGGKRIGVFGEVRFDIVRQLELMARASHQNYERRSLSIEEIDQNATGFAAGLRFRPAHEWMVSAEAQQMINTYFDDDWRLLIRAHYAFDFAPKR